MIRLGVCHDPHSTRSLCFIYNYLSINLTIMKKMFLKFGRNLLIPFALVSSYGAAQAQCPSVTLNPAADAYVNDRPGVPDVNYGTDPNLTIGAWTFGGVHSRFYTFVKFDLVSIPAGATIMSANLNLYGTAGNIFTWGHANNAGGTPGINASTISPVSASWQEGTITWNNQPGYSSTNTVAIPQSTTAFQNYTLDMLAMVKSMYINPATNYGFMVRQTTDNHNAELNFGSKESAVGTRPTLVVTYMPAPVISAPDISICQGKTSQFGATSSCGTGAWSLNTPLPALSGGATQNSTISASGLFTGNNPGIFKVRYTVTQTLNGTTFTSYSEKEITVGALPFTITGPASICKNGSGNYDVQQVQAGGTGNNLYEWSIYQSGAGNVPVDYASLSNFNLSKATLNANYTSATSIKLTATGKFYCFAGNTTEFKSQSISTNVAIVASPSGVRVKCNDATCNTLIAVNKSNNGALPAGLTVTWNGTSATGATFTNPKVGSSVYCEIKNSTGCTSYVSWLPKPTTLDACGRQLYDNNLARYCEQNYTLTTNPSCTSDNVNYRMENSEVNTTYQLNIFPNPATNKISIVSDGSYGSANIYDIDGVALKTQTLTEGRTMYDLDITAIPAGMYFLHVTSSNGKVYSAPLVKE